MRSLPLPRSCGDPAMTSVIEPAARYGTARDQIGDDLVADLADAMKVIDLLDRTDLSSPQRQCMAQLKTVMASLASGVDRAVQDLRRSETHPSVADIDETRFLHLLAIAGPRDSVELVSRLHADLKTARSGLFAALDRHEPDWAAVRAQTHVLVALAGAVGADTLQHVAEALNAAGRRCDLTEALDLRPEAARSLDQLIEYIARRDTTGAA